jgi:AcrR family transcriptional regulator
MAETREALLQAGAREFVEKGLDGASLNGICARAGYTRGAFYVHFRDRDDLLVAVVERELARFAEAIIVVQGEESDLHATIVRYVGAVLGGAPAARGAGRWQFHHTLAACAEIPKLREKYAAMQHAAIERVARAARSGQKAGAVRDDVEAKTIGEILVVLTLGVTAMLDVGASFDLAGGGRGIAKMVAPPKPRRARS